MNKESSNSIHDKSFEKNISEAFEIIQEKRRMQHYAEIILNLYSYSGVHKSDSLIKDYSLKVEEFFDCSLPFEERSKGEINRTIFELKEEIRIKMDEILKADILPYVNSMLKDYEVYLESSEIKEGHKVWKYEYHFFINVREKEEVS